MTEESLPTRDSIPVRRPHWRIAENRVYFLLSRKPYCHLSDTQLEVLNASNGKLTVGELIESDLAELDVLKELHRLQLIEFIIPQARSATCRVLIIEPHMDDAILSMGATASIEARSKDVTILTLFGKSSFTSYRTVFRDFESPEKTTELRLQESQLVARIIGAKHSVLPFSEQSLQHQLEYGWTEASLAFFEGSLSARMIHLHSTQEVSQYAAKILEALELIKPREVWIPLGVGDHSDHSACRDASLRALLKYHKEKPETRIYLYEDVPYTTRFPEHARRIISAMESDGFQIDMSARDVTEAAEVKRRLVSVYASQFKLDFIWPEVQAAARGRYLSTDFEERFYTLNKHGTTEGAWRYALEAPAIATALQELTAALKEEHRIHRVIILNMGAYGRPDLLVAETHKTFGDAKTEFMVAESQAFEWNKLKSDTIAIRFLAGNRSRRLWQIFRLMWHRRALILWIADASYDWRLRLVRWIMKRKGIVFCPSSSSLVSILQEVGCLSKSE